MAIDLKSFKEDALELENAGLRDLLTQAGVDAARLLAQAGIDAIENEVAKRLQRLLLEELHHRLKNLLTTVIAITSQSLRTARSPEEGRLAVENRLFALGRAHDLLLQTNWTAAKLADVVHTAIGPFDRFETPRFVVRDNDFVVVSSAVLPLTLSLNELCTNAVKYGALSNETGVVEIATQADDKALRLTWTEKGGPAVQEPTRRGFGTRLIVRLAAELHGKFHFKYEPAGLMYQLDVPLTVLAPA